MDPSPQPGSTAPNAPNGLPEEVRLEGDDPLSKFRRGEVPSEQLSKCHPFQSEQARTISRVIFDMILDEDNRVKQEIMSNQPLFSDIKIKLIVLVPQMNSLYNQTCASVPQELRELCGGTEFVYKRDDIRNIVVDEKSKYTLTLLIHDECHLSLPLRTGLFGTNSFTIGLSATPSDHTAVYDWCGNQRVVIPRPEGYIGFKTLLDAGKIVPWGLERGPVTGGEHNISRLNIFMQQYISAFDNRPGQGGNDPVQRVVNQLCCDPPVPLLIKLPSTDSTTRFKAAVEDAIRRNNLRITVKMHTQYAGTSGEDFWQYRDKAVIVLVIHKGGIGDSFPNFNYDLRGSPIQSDVTLVHVVGRLFGFADPRTRGTVIATEAMLTRLNYLCTNECSLTPESRNQGQRIILCTPCRSGTMGTCMSIAHTMLKYCHGVSKLPPTTGKFDWKLGPMWCKYGFANVYSKPIEYLLGHHCIESGLSETGNIYVHPKPDVSTEPRNEPWGKRAKIDPSMRTAVEESSLIGFSFYLPEGTTDINSLWMYGPPYPLCIPSYARSSVVTLEGYESDAMCDSERTQRRSVFIVLHRNDPDMHGYLHKHPSHCVVILPEGDGLGFARSMIQTMGETFNARKIWMLDDNIESWLCPNRTEPNQKISLSTVIGDVESAIEREEYDIGVLGFAESNNIGRAQSELWPRKHVYAAVLLNIEGLMESQVKYNTDHKRFEDVCFNIAVESYNLTASRKLPVVQCPWYSFQKRHTTTGGRSQLLVKFSAENVAVALSARRLVVTAKTPMVIYKTLVETVVCNSEEFSFWQRSGADNGTDVYLFEWAMLQLFAESQYFPRRPFIFIPQEETNITQGMIQMLQRAGIHTSSIHRGEESDMYYMTTN